MAREQRPINKAQAALDHRMAEQQEFQLRQAVQRATDPESRLQAIFALRNFLDQRRIDEMQDEADKNKTRIQRQKDRNNELFQDQIDAENKRFDLQKRSFNRQLQALERFLKSHPELWGSAQDKVLKLLRKFGGDFEDVGTRLGRRFKNGIKKQIMSVVEDLKVISEYEASRSGDKDSTVLPDWFFALFPKFAEGTMKVSKDQLAFLHAGEMVVPASEAKKLRAMNTLGGPKSDTPLWSPTLLPQLDISAAPDERNGGKGGTIIFQVGNQMFAETTDRSLYIQSSVYTRKSAKRVSRSQR